MTKVNTVYYSNLFSGVVPDSDYNPVKVLYHQSAEDYSFITSLRFKNGDKTKVRIRVDGETFQILEVKKLGKKASELINELHYDYHLVSDNFFVFLFDSIRKLPQPQSAVKKTRLEDFYKFLTISNLDFQILDQSSEIRLRGWSAIGMVSLNRVISLGATHKDIYLHEVNTKTQKLILLKKVSLSSKKISFELNWWTGLFSFCVMTSMTGPSLTQFSVLNFDQDLRLISNLKVEGFYNQMHLIPLANNKVLMYPNYRRKNYFRLYILDFEARTLRRIYESKGLELSRSADSSGDAQCYAVKRLEDSFEMVVLA